MLLVLKVKKKDEKVNLYPSTPLRNIGSAEISLPLFLTLEVSSQRNGLAALLTKNPGTH